LAILSGITATWRPVGIIYDASCQIAETLLLQGLNSGW